MSNIDAATYGHYLDANNRVLLQAISACTNGSIDVNDIEFNNIIPYYPYSSALHGENRNLLLRTAYISKIRVVVIVHIRNFTALHFSSHEKAFAATSNILKTSVLSGKFNDQLALRSSASSSDVLDGVTSNEITFVVLDSSYPSTYSTDDDKYNQWGKCWVSKDVILGLGVTGAGIMIVAFFIRVLYIRHYHRQHFDTKKKLTKIVPIIAIPVCEESIIQPEICFEHHLSYPIPSY